MELKLALSGTELNADESISSLVASAQRNGVDWIELWYPKNLQYEGRAKTVAQIKRAGLDVVCISSGTEMMRKGDIRKDQETLIEAIELAHDLNAPFANTYFGYLEEQNDELAIAQYCANLAPCLKRAEQLNVTITLENEFDVFGLDNSASDVTRRPESSLHLVKQVSSNYFRLTFDPCNAYFAGIEPFPYMYDLLRPYISYVHFKDGHRLPSKEAGPRGWRTFSDSGVDFTTCPAGQGALNWPGLILRLLADGYNGFVSIEPHADLVNRTQAWDQAVEAFRSWLAHAKTNKQQGGNE